MERSKDFIKNVQDPIIKYREREDLDEIKKEVLWFACPWCGHIMPDHQWVAPMSCLKDDCSCSWWDDENPQAGDDDNHYFDVTELNKDIEAAWDVLSSPI